MTERIDILVRTVDRLAFRDWWLSANTAEESLTWFYPCVDPDSGEHLLLQGRPWLLTNIPTERMEREIVTTAFLGVRVILEHEAREEFRLDGIRPFDPHSRPIPGLETS